MRRTSLHVAPVLFSDSVHIVLNFLRELVLGDMTVLLQPTPALLSSYRA